MSQDVRQWLAEIKVLQQKLVEAQQEREEAYASASKWRSLYETEAKQRRADANLSKQTIDTLHSELEQLRSRPYLPDTLNLSDLPDLPAAALAEQQVAQIPTDDLQQRLTTVLMACDRYAREVDRLTQALKTEQTEHTTTRKSLTTALGDTVDMLAKERAGRGAELSTQAANGYSESAAGEAKTPSLELPTLD